MCDGRRVFGSVHLPIEIYLGREEIDGSQKLPGVCQPVGILLIADESKVEQSQGAVSINDQIGRLDIAMDESMRMSTGQTGRGLPQKVTRPGRMQWAFFGNKPGEIFSVDVFGYKIMDFTRSTSIHGAENIGMLQLSEACDFFLESMFRVRVLQDVAGQKFHGDLFAQSLVTGQKDLPHSAVSDAFTKFVVNRS